MGCFILTDTFSANELFQRIWPYVGRPDEIRYVFGKYTVALKRLTENKVEVQVAVSK